MNLKRILALVLALVMVLAFTACGASGETETKTETETETKTNDDGFEVRETELFTTNIVPRGTSYVNNDETTATKKTDANTLVVGGNVSIVKAEPNNSLYCPELATIYDRLMEYNIATGEYEPMLATKWEQVDDTTFELWLRDDVYFHNGEKFTADDVVYSLERLKDTTKDPKWWDQFSVIDIENIEIVDDYHMIYHFNWAWGNFCAYFSCPWGGVMCREYVEANGEDSFWDAPNGTGPFKQSEIVTGEKVVMVKNDNYWGECDPGYDTIVYRFYSDVSTMFIDFEAGNLDVIYQVSPEDCERILAGEVANANLQTIELGSPYDLNMYMYGDPNTIGDANVRKAIMKSIDTTTMADVVMGILGKETKRVVPASLPYGYDEPYGYDVEGAKEALAASNYNDGSILISNNSSRDTSIISELLQAMCAEVGIDIDIISSDAATHTARSMGVNNGGVPECDITCFTGLTISSMPQMFFSQLKTGSGYAIGSTQNEYLNNLFIEAEQTADEDRIAEIYQEVADILYEQCNMVPIVDVYQGIAYYDYINYWDINWTKHDVLYHITLAA